MWCLGVEQLHHALASKVDLALAAQCATCNWAKQIIRAGSTVLNLHGDPQPALAAGFVVIFDSSSRVAQRPVTRHEIGIVPRASAGDIV